MSTGNLKAWIISIGDELLKGIILNTNATWLARRLTELGVNVHRILVIGDNLNEIISTLKDAFNYADVIVLTGGLGPTEDDRTSEAIAKAFNMEWVINKDAYNEVKRKLERLGYKLTKERVKMAKMPKTSIALKNRIGIAPGIYLQLRGKHIFALPGVPKEMIDIFDNEVKKILLKILPKGMLLEKDIEVVNISESDISKLINNLQKSNPRIYIKSLVRGSRDNISRIIIHIEMYTTYEDSNRSIKEFNKVIKQICDEVKHLGGIISPDITNFKINLSDI